jgi:toxin ParE1/3/4
MLMPCILRRPLVESDLEEIWWYIAQDNLDGADQLLAKLEARLSMLANTPYMGSKRDEIFPNLRSSPVGNYLIFYYPLSDGIEILRVLHGARDIAAVLLDESSEG